MIEDEQVLSQKLSQLSTSKQDNDDDTVVAETKQRRANKSTASIKKRHREEAVTLTTTTTSPVFKKLKSKSDEENHFDNSIPSYLLPSNKSFVEMIEKEQCLKNKSPNIVDDLRQIALVLHQLAVNHLQQDLWSTYILCGTGRLKQALANTELTTSITHGPHIWPVKVKSFILSNSSSLLTTVVEKEHDQACLRFANKFIGDLNKQRDQYRDQLNEKKRKCSEYTEVIEQALQTYIERERIDYLRLKCELKKALLAHYYFEQTFQWQYQQLNPNEYQVRTCEARSPTDTFAKVTVTW